MHIISIANQKGGVGKTTTTINLSASLASLGKKVLVIDIDPQGNTSHGLGVNEYDKTIYEAIMGEGTQIYETEFGVDVIPADIRLFNAEQELSNKVARELRLSKALVGIGDYDFIIIDCNPFLGLLTFNALSASDYVLIPLETGSFSAIGLNQLHTAIEEIQTHINDRLQVLGYIITRVETGTNLAREFQYELREVLGDKLFSTTIRRNVKIAESQSAQKPVLHYEPKASGAKEYMDLAKELLERV